MLFTGQNLSNVWLREADMKLGAVDFRLFKMSVKSVTPWGNLMIPITGHMVAMVAVV